jgi:glycosyltransferase involved in cell wall biosynthesis
LRVLLTVHQFLPKHSFGTERLTFDTGKELLRRRHEVYVLTTDNASPALPHNEAWDYNYRGLKVRTIGIHPPGTPDPLRYEFDNPDMADHMRAYMKEIKPDLVHVIHAGRLSGSIIPAAKEFGVPVVFTATDFWSLCRVIHLKRADTGELCLGPNRSGTNCLHCFIARTNAPPKIKEKYLSKSEIQFRALSAASRNPIMRRTGYMKRTRTVVDRIGYLKKAVNLCDRVIAPTKLNRDLLIRNGIKPGHIELYPYGMDISDIETAPQSPLNPPVLRIGYIGSLARHKGVDTLIKAFKGIPEMMMPAELKIYGSPNRDPDYFEELQELAGADERISFTGTFEGEKIGWVFSDMDVLVVPSRWYENTPLVVYSAFAAGTPVVATDLGGLSEAIEHGKNGLLFEMDDARDLNEQLLRFHFEPDLLARLREGIEPVRTAEDSVDELERLYRELLGSGKSASQAG